MSNKKSKLQKESDDKDFECRNIFGPNISTLSERELKSSYMDLEAEYKSLHSRYEDALVRCRRAENHGAYLDVYIEALKDKFLPKEVDGSQLSEAVYLIFSVLSFIALIYLICLLTP
jgi:hypothetical protein